MAPKKKKVFRQPTERNLEIQKRRDVLRKLGAKKVAIPGLKTKFAIQEVTANLVHQFLQKHHRKLAREMYQEARKQKGWIFRGFRKPIDTLPSLPDIFNEFKASGSKGDHSSTKLTESKTQGKKREIEIKEDDEDDYPFDVDEADHAETPLTAYKDIAGALQGIAASVQKSAEELKIYDPYYCQGTCKQHLASIGFPNVYNVKEDFYQCIEDNTTPEFDVLVTNPPYSGDHVEKLIRFCRKVGKPCLLLLPKFFYMKGYFAKVLESSSFICPASRYVYEPPKNTKDHCGKLRTKKTKKTSPFASMWYILNASVEAAVKWRNLPNEYRDDGDPNRVRGQKKTKLSDGRALCGKCGQVKGNCKHTK